MKSQHLALKFSAALPYDRYVLTGTEEQQRRWKQVYDLTAPTPAQGLLLAGFVRKMNVLIVSGIWCGDCVQQCPLIARLADAAKEKIEVRFVDRDEHRDLAEQLRINGGDRVPMALFLAEDHELCAVYGDRTLNRYRALAIKQLGASCPAGIVPPDQEERLATMQDWANEFERVQLMLRLSPRLRQKHGD